jgi:hypothetical protein
VRNSTGANVTVCRGAVAQNHHSRRKRQNEFTDYLTIIGVQCKAFKECVVHLAFCCRGNGGIASNHQAQINRAAASTRSPNCSLAATKRQGKIPG